MKAIVRTFFLLVLGISVGGSLQAQLLMNDEFSGAAGTALTGAGWTISGTSTTNPLTITSPGLTFTGHPSSGVGNAVPMANTGQDVYKSFAAVNSGSVYLSFLMNVSAALTGDYIIAVSPTSSQTNYYARFHIKAGATAGTYNVGMSKSNEVTGGAQYGTTAFSFNSTYFVVVKYSFVGPAADTLNDAISIYMFGSGASIAAEPATPEVNAYVNSTKNDAADLSFVTLRQGSNTAAPTLVIDALRVSKSWAGILTGIDATDLSVPTRFSLSQNYPNPFNPSTTIRYELPKASSVSLQVFNALGQRVATLVESQKEAGTHLTTWNANVPSGMYLYRLTAGGYTETRTMMLLK